MREKLIPWIPAYLCGALALVTVVTDIVGRFTTGTPNLGLSAFMLFLPMCFYHVGVLTHRLREENQILRKKVDDLTTNEETLNDLK